MRKDQLFHYYRCLISSFFEIHFTPTNNSKVLKVMSKNGVEQCKYYFLEDARFHVSLKSETYKSIISFDKSKEYLMEEISESSKIKKIDLIARNDEHYDYFIVAKDDWLYHQSPSKCTKDIPLQEAIDLIRILLVNLGYFYVSSGYKINE